MKYIIWLLPIILLMGCAPKNDVAEWQQQQLNAIKTMQQQYEAQTDNLTKQLNASQKQAMQLQADLKNSETLRLQSERQLENAPTQQQYDSLKGELQSSNNALVLEINKGAEAQDRIAMLSQGWDQLNHKAGVLEGALKDLRNKLIWIDNHLELSIVIGDKYTQVERDAFYKIWFDLKLSE